GLPLVVVGQQPNLRCMEQPGQPILVHPLRRGEVEDPPDDLEGMVDGAGALSLSAPPIDPRLQQADVDAIDGDIANQPHQQFELHDVACQAALVLIFEDELARGLLEGSRRPYPVDLRLALFLHDAREHCLGFPELSCASAAANSPPEQALVDMEPSGSLDEA